jgi:hypothetical protein
METAPRCAIFRPLFSIFAAVRLGAFLGGLGVLGGAVSLR